MASFIARNSEQITGDLDISAINHFHFPVNKSMLFLNLPGSEKFLRCGVFSNRDTRGFPTLEQFVNVAGAFKSGRFIGIIQSSPNLLEFIQQMSRDLQCKAKLENWSVISSRGEIGGLFTMPEGSRALNQNPLFSILSRHEFNTTEFYEFVNNLLKNINLMAPLSTKYKKIKGEVPYKINTFVFGDGKTFSDAPEYAAFAKLMAQNITLITFDQ